MLTERFYEFIQALIDKDEEKIKQVAEARFASKIIENLPKLNDFKFERGPGLSSIAPSETNYGDLRHNLVSDIEGDYLVDCMLVRGVSPDRSQNESNFDYTLDRTEEDSGLRYYRHKYFDGYEHYYQHLEFQKTHEKMLELDAIVK